MNINLKKLDPFNEEVMKSLLFESPKQPLE